MKKEHLILIIICCLGIITIPSKAETITYDFSSNEYWATEPNGSISPGEGTSALLTSIYYKETNDCFVGSKEVYFNEGYLMLKTGASLKLPHYPNDWTINKIILHSHSETSTSVKVNIYTAGYAVSSTLQWTQQNGDYEYKISSNEGKSPLYIKTTNSYNARITRVTIDYTPINSSSLTTPIFNPGSTTFESDSLEISISATEGCEIYYTTDGTTPSYTNPENHVGTKGDIVTIYVSNSPCTLKAIAVNPTTKECSNVSSALYTYVTTSAPDDTPEISIINDGTKGSPYTVAEAKAIKEYLPNKWIKGTIYGTMVDKDIAEIETSDFKNKNNIVIGDSLVQVPIQLSDSKDIQNKINLVDHPYLKGKELLILGDLYEYGRSKGVISPEQYEITYEIPINNYGHASLYLDMPVKVPTGSTAYYCTTDGNEVDTIPVGSIIPDSVGVIITSKPNTTCILTYTTTSNDQEETILAENQLIGFVEDTIVTTESYNYYALNAKNGKVGFFIPQTDTEEGFIAKAYKSYLRVSIEQNISAYYFHSENDETRMAPITHISEDIIYDLQGRVVTNPTQGIYIRGEKKIVIY